MPDAPDSPEAPDRPASVAAAARRALLAARGKQASPPVDETPVADATSDVAHVDTDVRGVTEPAVSTPVVADAVPTDAATTDAVTTDGVEADAVPTDAVAPPPGRTVVLSKGATPDVRPPATRSYFTAIAALVLAAALLFAGISGVLWWRAGHNDTRSLALARDQIAVDARLAIATVNSSDYHHPSDAVQNWLKVTTGTLHSEYAQSKKQATALVGESKIVSKATVLDLAVTDINLHRGVATAIASVNLTRKPVKGAATTVRNRLSASLQRVGGTWKLSNLTVVQVALQ